MEPKNISRRDYFAAMVLRRMLIKGEHLWWDDPVKVLPYDAVICADKIINQFEE